MQYGENRVFILVLYEKIPVYCFNCVRVGHGDAICSFAGTRRQTNPPMPSISMETKLVQMDVSLQFGLANEEQDGNDIFQ